MAGSAGALGASVAAGDSIGSSVAKAAWGAGVGAAGGALGGVVGLNVALNSFRHGATLNYSLRAGGVYGVALPAALAGLLPDFIPNDLSVTKDTNAGCN